ncbi:molecular chaperone [Escherichia coli]|uniref:fimbrial biogenesis chaperone n=1 Tax=Escherichia coli TaxID=562 RepID=UPI0038B2BA41|nr:molecular chaperone [Escherichia coli]
MARYMSFFFTTAFMLQMPTIVCAEGFGINATRLVYPEKDKSISVTVRNTMQDQPYLVQASVSSQQDEAKPAPFSVTPPLFRLEPNSINQIRIAFTGAALPKDRESIFYFQATGIPASISPMSPQQNAGVKGVVQFGIGNIIKLFYRPSGLVMTATEAQKNLLFRQVATGVEVVNNSPYFINLAGFSVGGKKISLSKPDELMLAPYTKHTYPSAQKQGAVEWMTINDIGGIDVHKANMP